MRKLPILGIALGLLIALVVVVGGSGRQHSGADTRAGAPAGDAPLAGTPASFTYLAAQNSNRCDLQPSELLRYPDSRRLQGSCCQAMDRATYEGQLRKLRAYAGVSAIPANPYDIPARLAKRLLGYQRTIKLTPAQQTTYRRAMKMSSLKGPCCCHCWRWDAFQGLSYYLIARKGWTASQVARVIDTLEGCGGADNASGSAHPRSST